MQGCKILVGLMLLSVGCFAQCDSLTQYRKWQYLPYANFINNYLDSLPQPVPRRIFIDQNGFTKLHPLNSHCFVPTLVQYSQLNTTVVLPYTQNNPFAISERFIDSLYFVFHPADTIFFKPCLH